MIVSLAPTVVEEFFSGVSESSKDAVPDAWPVVEASRGLLAVAPTECVVVTIFEEETVR